MKNLMKRVLGVLVISVAVVTNVGAVSISDVNAKVGEVIERLRTNPAGIYDSRPNRAADAHVLSGYANQYPAIKSQIATINHLLMGSIGNNPNERNQSAQPGGAAFKAAQAIKVALGNEVAPVNKAEQKKEEKQVTQDLKGATKDLDKANAELKKVEKQNETAKTTEAQARAQKAMDDAAARVAQKTQELRDMEASLSQNKQQVLVVMEREKALNARVEDLKKQLMNKDLEINKKNELQDALTANTKELEDVKKDLKEKSEGLSSAEKKALDDAARATRNARLAIGATGVGAGLFGYAAGTGAIGRAYTAASTAVSPYATRVYNAASKYGSQAYTAASPYMTKRAAAVVTGVGAVGAAGAMAYKYYKTATPKDVAANANKLEQDTAKLKTEEKLMIDKPTPEREQKIEDIKVELDSSSAKTVKALEEMRTWKGDLRGYSQQQIDVAVNALIPLYAKEKELTKQLDELTDKGIIKNTPKKDREADHKELTSQLKKVRADIKNQEAIAGITRSKAIRRGVWALGTAALIGAAVAADWYFETGLMGKAYNAMPDVRGGLNRAYNAMPDVRGRVSRTYNAMPNIRENMPDIRGRLNRTYEAMPSLPAWVPGSEAAKRIAAEQALNAGIAAGGASIANAARAKMMAQEAQMKAQAFYEQQAARAAAGASEANIGGGYYTPQIDEQ